MELTRLSLNDEGTRTPDEKAAQVRMYALEGYPQDRGGYWFSRFFCRHEYGIPIGTGDRAYVECQKCGKQSEGVSIGAFIRRDTTPRPVKWMDLPRISTKPTPPKPLTAIPVPQDRGAWAALILRREYGQYAGRAFALSPDVDWVLHTDDMGVRVLVPCKRGEQ